MSLQPYRIFTPHIFLDRRVNTILNLLGYLLIAASIFYLVAANWWMLPKIVKLFVPPIFLLCSALASIYSAEKLVYRQAFDTFSALMLGLSLAVIGQTYQTGADSYLLFLLWSVLLLPWLIRQNIGVFTVFCVVIQLALYLYFQQTYLLSESAVLYLLFMNLLLAGCFIWSVKQYPSLVFGFIAAFYLMSVMCMLNYVFHSAQTHFAYLLSAFILPTVTSVYFYLRAQIVETSLMAIAVALNLSIWFIIRHHELLNSIFGIIFLAILLFIGFAFISLGLKRTFPNSKLSVMPSALGAWLSGVILSSAVLIFNASIAILLGSTFVLLAWFLLKKSSGLFVRQLAYCLWICGQIAVLAYSFDLSESFGLVLLLQIMLIGLSIIARVHWFKLSLQMILAQILFVLAILIQAGYPPFLINAVNYVLIIIAIFTASYWQGSSYVYSVACTMVGIFFVQALIGYLNVYQPNSSPLLYTSQWMNITYYVLPCAVLLSFVFNQKTNIHYKTLVAISTLALILIYFGYFEIFVMLMLLGWALANRYRLIQVISALALLFWLWMWYYNLNLPLLNKSISIFCSGLAVILLAWLLSQYHLKRGQVV